MLKNEKIHEILTNPPITNFSHMQNGWQFMVTKSIIAKSDVITKIGNENDIRMPDQYFDKDNFQIHNSKYNFLYEVSPIESLKLCNFEKLKMNFTPEYKSGISQQVNAINFIPKKCEVKNSSIWKKKDFKDIKDLQHAEQKSDWFFSTPYKGIIGPIFKPKENVYSSKKEHKEMNLYFPYLELTKEEIPVKKLGENNPILWAEMIDLWGDDLQDNGLSEMWFRLRVMKNSFFGLLRQYLRVDDMLIRIIDTRIYHEFDTNYILREFSCRENSYDEIKKKQFIFSPKFSLDREQSFKVYDFLDIVYMHKEKIVLFDEIPKEIKEIEKTKIEDELPIKK